MDLKSILCLVVLIAITSRTASIPVSNEISSLKQDNEASEFKKALSLSEPLVYLFSKHPEFVKEFQKLQELGIPILEDLIANIQALADEQVEVDSSENKNRMLGDWVKLAEMIAAELLKLFQLGDIDFLGHPCSYTLKPRISKFKLKWDAKFWCDGWNPFAGYGTGSGRQSSIEKAIHDFSNKVVASGQVTEEQVNDWIKKHT